MTTYFIRRFLLMIPTLIGVTIVAFLITRIVPGGPIEREIMRIRQAAVSGEGGPAAGTNIDDPTSDIPPEAIAELEKEYGFDKPWYIAYFLWLKKVALFDLGESYYYKEPVGDMIIQRFPISLVFGLTGFVLSYLVCIPLGILKALRHGTLFDFVSSAIVFVGYSIPGWAMGALLLLLLASGRFYELFPAGEIKTKSYDKLPAVIQKFEPRDDVSDEFGTFEWEKLSPFSKVVDRAYHMALPVFCYMLSGFATLTVLTKNSLMENMGQDYVRTAFAKGLAPRRVILLHTLRNSLIPIATGLGHALGLLMAGSYLIEWIFNIDGIGYFGFTAILQRDYMVVLGVLVVNTVLMLLGNIFSDMLYALIDPRIRFE